MNRWEEMWQRPTQGFHQDDINPHLVEHFEWLSAAGKRAFVPLCGRSRDMDWLAEQGCRVIGAELVESPVVRFFEERGRAPARTPLGPLERFEDGPFTLLRGDVLEATADMTGPVDILFDRAALIALPTPVRARYAPHLATLCRPGSRGLLVTLHYDQSAAPGPPYSVDDTEVEARFGEQWDLEAVDHRVPRRIPAKFDGLDVQKTVWRMQRKG